MQYTKMLHLSCKLAITMGGLARKSGQGWGTWDDFSTNVSMRSRMQRGRAVVSVRTAARKSILMVVFMVLGMRERGFCVWDSGMGDAIRCDKM